MYGRYGADELYNFLTYFNITLILVNLIFTAFMPEGIAKTIVMIIFSIAITGIFFWEIFRMMSKNIAKRRRENERYLKIKMAIKRFFTGNTSRGTKTMNRDDASFVFRDCTKCGSTLRLPRRAGKHKVKCPRCSHSFYIKAKAFNYKKNK